MKKQSGSMPLWVKLLVAVAVIVGLVFSLSVLSTKTPVKEIEAGRHYERVSDVNLTDKDVVIFFWYGCPHCLKAYQAFDKDGFFSKLSSQGKTVRRVPVIANKTWDLHARLYHALSLKRLSSEGHLYAMEAIQKNSATTARSIERILPGIIDNELKRNPNFKATPEGVIKDMNSSRVDSLLVEDRALTATARVEGVPTLLIGGKDRVVISSSVGYSDISVVSLKLLGNLK